MILKNVIRTFVRTADPVGSKTVADQLRVDLSPASIRNTMSALEERGLLDHPHTSAGRIPTIAGYRAYVDTLMRPAPLSASARQRIQDELAGLGGDAWELIREGTRVLAEMSSLLSIVLTPKLSTGVLHRIDAIPLASTRVLFVITVRSGLVNQIVLEVESDLDANELQTVLSSLNERLSGLKLSEIRDTLDARLRELGRTDSSGILRLILKHASVLFSEQDAGQRAYVTGTQHLVGQPEFRRPEIMQGLVRLIEDDRTVAAMLDRTVADASKPFVVSVRIGEDGETGIDTFSVVATRYVIGETVGTVGVLGPTRMDYDRAVTLVRSMSRRLHETHSRQWDPDC